MIKRSLVGRKLKKGRQQTYHIFSDLPCTYNLDVLAGGDVDCMAVSRERDRERSEIMEMWGVSLTPRIFENKVKHWLVTVTKTKKKKHIAWYIVMCRRFFGCEYILFDSSLITIYSRYGPKSWKISSCGAQRAMRY